MKSIKLLKISLLMIFILGFVGCGGGSSSSGDNTETPIITNPEDIDRDNPITEDSVDLNLSIIPMKGPAANGMTNNGVNIVYITINGEVYEHDLSKEEAKQIGNVNRIENQVILSLAFKTGSDGEYFYGAFNPATIKTLNINNGVSKEIHSTTSLPDGIDFYNEKIYVVNANNDGILLVLNPDGTEDHRLDTGIDDIVGISHTDKFLYILGENGDIYQTDSKTAKTKVVFINETITDAADGELGLEAITILNNKVYVSNVNVVESSDIYKIDIDLSEHE